VLYGRDLCRSGGTGKAEGAKLPGTGIGPKQCPGKLGQKKAGLADSVASPDAAESDKNGHVWAERLLVTARCETTSVSYCKMVLHGGNISAQLIDLLF
jgi:hypothetical protein